MATAGSGQVRYARNGDVRIAFEELGGAGGDPLLLIMGLAVSRFWWPDTLVDEFAGRGLSRRRLRSARCRAVHPFPGRGGGQPARRGADTGTRRPIPPRT